MTARFLVGDTRDRLGDIPDHTVDLVLTSPPFLALRSYLPEDHPDKDREIGSEATPAEFIDVLLELTAGWGRVLAPHGSIAVELGDTYAGSGGAGGDYGDAGWRSGQLTYKQAQQVAPSDGRGPRLRDRRHNAVTGNKNRDKRPGWPLDKSLTCIPQLYQVALAYGINPLTGQESPAGRWRVRTLKPWIRSNPPVGALGDKERPATSYVIVACRATDRWFDLDAVRTTNDRTSEVVMQSEKRMGRHTPGSGPESKQMGDELRSNPAGAPPRDWWHHVDAVLDAELALRAGRYNGGENPAGRPAYESDKERRSGGTLGEFDDRRYSEGDRSMGAQGVHLRRALERAGILTTLEALDVSPKGYSGAHYAVWPPELVRLLVDEMCPRRVCTTCGQPSRRITEATDDYAKHLGQSWADRDAARPKASGTDRNSHSGQPAGSHIISAQRTTLGWSDCGHNAYRPGHVLDPFAGSGTTLAVCTGMARDVTGIDIDERNAWLAQERVGMFLEVDHISREDSADGSLTTGVSQ